MVSLPVFSECLVCGHEPHDEWCPVPEHEAMLAGDEAAKAAHVPEECHLCLMGMPAHCGCRCGRCCEALIIEATAFDARREPRIRERGSPITEGGQVPLDECDWLLNGKGGPCVFLGRNPEGEAVCEIYETRPLACRLFDCNSYEHRKETR